MEVYHNGDNAFNEENDTNGINISPSEKTEHAAAPIMKEDLTGTDNHKLDEALSIGVIRLSMTVSAGKKPLKDGHTKVEGR